MKRIRTHANPLACPNPSQREEWTAKLDETKTVHVDMGCGQGYYIAELAKNNPEKNYVGIEVREAMCAKANEKLANEKITNATCVHGNASISLKTLFKENEVQEIYINFPDPWMKERYKKRRMIKDFVVENLYSVLSENGVIYLLSDVKEVYDEFYELLSKKFKAIPYKQKEEKTYWQKWHEEKGTILYASCFEK